MHRDQLETLAALIDEGTFDAAARRLHVTPSAVSQRVKAMEQAAGQVLVRRTSPVEVTEAGAVVLRHARQVALLEADTLRTLGAGTGATAVALAVNADSLATWFLPCLAGLGGRVTLDLRREDQEHTVGLLRSGTVMAAVTSTREAVQGCSIEPLGVMRYRAVCAPRFGAAHGLPGTLESAPVVYFDRDDDLQEAFLRRRGLLVGAAPRHYIPTSDDFARAIALGFGWGLLPEQQCLSPLEDGSLIELAPDEPLDVELFWQRWNLRSETLDAVSDTVRAGAAAALRPPAGISAG
ncbi:LysR family transcriptional regulator [Frondihabitans sp. PhB188]|uniref:LysR family transcriptional regulator ArgP n=1 Tax=Frondihabitans sp. PhB188 TaxID=2485200 RepID=UPI000F4A9974|nr:LysR family transcriptional regulator ArgP [Frondihabitans sp. PhB188]ROQ37371.1 LysR family transcriptional regulator [Frondihabitans sp. PhB188]